jgi:riboflavin-specific deaminase-like protein
MVPASAGLLPGRVDRSSRSRLVALRVACALMRQLLPEPRDDIDPAEAYGGPRPRPGNRPWVMVDMVASLDGAIAIDGRSGALGGPGDHRVFHALRGLADLILVGAATVRAEAYGPVRLTPELQEARVLRGQAPVPRLAIVSRRLDLDLSSPLFTESDPPPLVVTAPSSSMARRAEIAAIADLLLAGQTDDVDLVAALEAFGEMGIELVVCEGGPTINGQLLEADLFDELCLTLAPKLVGGRERRVVDGAEPLLRDLDLVQVLAEGDELYLRAVRKAT